MESQDPDQKRREYYLDFLRIFLILTVFLYHIGMIFNSSDWHIKNDTTSEYKSMLWYIMVYLGRWRMPLLILISGAGTFFAFGKRTPEQFLKERFKRLFIPLLAGIFILVPVQVYLERADQYISLLDYYPHMFEGVYPGGNFSWHHLWFIAYLFFIVVVLTPLIHFIRENKFKSLINWLNLFVARRMGANIFLLPIILSQLILRPYFPENTNDLVHDWAAMSYYILYFLSGYILVSNETMLESIKRSKLIFLTESLIATLVMFTVPYMVNSEKLANYIWDLSGYVLAWSSGLSAIGYAKQYLNKDNQFRKLANEAIYPFYLLHQPIIVILGSLIVELDIAIIWKVFAISISSFLLTIAVYWWLIKRFNLMRLMFGMKSKSEPHNHLKQGGRLSLRAVQEKFLFFN